MKIIIPGQPQPKQSARFKIVKSKKSNKNFVMSYQSKSVVDNAFNISATALSQLPLNFVPFDCAVSVNITFVFPILKSWDKKTRTLFENGATIYKTSKPDTDNCLKALFDGLNGVLFVDDSRVVRIVAEKIYGKEPRIEIELLEI